MILLYEVTLTDKEGFYNSVFMDLRSPAAARLVKKMFSDAAVHGQKLYDHVEVVEFIDPDPSFTRAFGFYCR